MWGDRKRQTGEGGFTLVELLVTIVVAGVLTAVAMVGMGGLNHSGETAACAASMDAANAASSAYYANSGGQYPQTFSDLTSPPTGAPLFDASAVVIQSPTTLTGKGGWTLTMNPGPTTSDRTTFSGC